MSIIILGLVFYCMGGKNADLRHIAIVQDGNGSYGISKNPGEDKIRCRIFGHNAGYQIAQAITDYHFKSTSIDNLTFRTTSTANLERDQREVKNIFQLTKNALEVISPSLEQASINFRWIGNEQGLPDDLVKLFESKVEEHSYESSKHLILAMNYGGNDEIQRAAQRAIQTMQENNPNMKLKELNLNSFRLKSDFEVLNIPEPDLIIRTKTGEGVDPYKTSGFLPFAQEKAIWYYLSKMYPKFTIQDYKLAIEYFHKNAEKRNFGK